MRGPTRRRFIAMAAAAVGSASLTPRNALATPRWVDQRQTGPFVVSSTFDLTPYGKLLAELPQLETELRRVLALRPCSVPINLRLLGDQQAHRDYLHERFPDAPYRRALFVKQEGNATVFAYKQPELAIDLRHECTHALLHADLPMMPLWLDEGLAEYFELPSEQRTYGGAHAGALRWNLRLGFIENLVDLEAKHELEALTQVDYRFAWAWTHFLLHGPRVASEQLWGFLSDIRRGQPPGLLSQRLDRVLPDVQAAFVRHFRQWPRVAKR